MKNLKSEHAIIEDDAGNPALRDLGKCEKENKHEKLNP